jgi:gliding motility-associated-like protein
MPENSKIQPDKNYGRQDANGWCGPFLIVSESGKELGSMRGAVCYDANNNYITAAYKFENINGKQKIKIIVPNSWLNNPNRVYPITIDPLVTGPTSTFTGSLIPSCISPASGSDSILVTIPANISVTGFFVSGSFYANPFSTAIMNHGAMSFRTSCNTSSSFTTSGSVGLSPGTAYLTAYDMKSPLLCCFPQSCTAQTFYLSMHITRTVGGTGCNTFYIYHDPLSTYPFSAYVEGRTIEGYGPIWSVTPTNICSDVCTITGSVYMRYGVPPFTITHPWMSGSVSTGTPAGCSTATASSTLTLNIPNCPWTCDTISTLSIPSPTVTDACGTVLTGTPAVSISIKEVPEVTATPNFITICSGESFSTTLTPCLSSSVVSWSGNSLSGTGTIISDTLINTSSTVSSTTYQVSATNNTCQSDTITVTVNTVPLPIANFSATPQPVIINTPITFTDNSSTYGGSATNWYWTFGDGTFDMNQNPTHSYSIPDTYTVCLAMQTTESCVDTVCQDVTVIPAELVLPNVVTPNGDNMNDVLYFKYLEFFGVNNLVVYNRWGKIVYQKDNYTNDWVPSNLSDGTYYYILTVENNDPYKGFLQVFKN